MHLTTVMVISCFKRRHFHSFKLQLYPF